MVISQGFLSSIRPFLLFRISLRARVKGSDFQTATPSFLKSFKNARQRANFGGSLRTQHAVDYPQKTCADAVTMGKKSGGRVRVKQVGPKAPVNPLDALSIPPEEMITFPVKPDTNVSQIWPMSTWC
jgi:hypothetical protein